MAIFSMKGCFILCFIMKCCQCIQYYLGGMSTQNSNANVYCNEKYKSNLATIHNDIQQQNAWNLCKQSIFNDCWINIDSLLYINHLNTNAINITSDNLVINISNGEWYFDDINDHDFICDSPTMNIEDKTTANLDNIGSDNIYILNGLECSVNDINIPTILTEVTLNECIHNGRINGYLILNYFEDDSHCYMYDKNGCELTNIWSNNSSIIVYNNPYMDDETKCMDYPHTWKDKNEMSCSVYNEYSYCVNNSINEYYFDTIIDMQDNIFNYNAMDVCCSCGGGIQLYNEYEILYIYNKYDTHLYTNYNSQICKWNNNNDLNNYSKWNIHNKLYLFSLCQTLNERYYVEMNCMDIIDIIDITVCIHNDNNIENTMYFTYLIQTDINHNINKVYINTQFFDINTMNGISSLIYLDYNVCVNDILTATNVDTFGILPCDVSVSDTEITRTPNTDDITVFIKPDNSINTNTGIIPILVCSMSIICIVLSVLSLYYRYKSRKYKRIYQETRDDNLSVKTDTIDEMYYIGRSNKKIINERYTSQLNIDESKSLSGFRANIENTSSRNGFSISHNSSTITTFTPQNNTNNSSNNNQSNRMFLFDDDNE